MPTKSTINKTFNNKTTIKWSDLLYLQGLKDKDPVLYATEYDRIMHRTPACQSRYDQDNLNLQMLGKTRAGHLKEDVLKVEDGETFIKIMANNYGYHLEKGIDHDVIWLSPEFNGRGTLDGLAYLYVSNKYKNWQGCIILQAPEQSRSVPEILHYHLFIKN